MSELDVARTAKRLGLTDAVICQLRAYGYLHRLDLTADELDARIYRAHLANLGAMRSSGPWIPGGNRAQHDPRIPSVI